MRSILSPTERSRKKPVPATMASRQTKGASVRSMRWRRVMAISGISAAGAPAAATLRLRQRQAVAHGLAYLEQGVERCLVPRGDRPAQAAELLLEQVQGVQDGIAIGGED